MRVAQAAILMVIAVAVFWAGFSGGLINNDTEEIPEPERCETLDCSNSELGSFCYDIPLPAHCGCTLDEHCYHLEGDYKCGDENKCVK